MPRVVSLIAVAGWLTLVASVPADIVWSGVQYQRAYHDISSLDFNQDGTDGFMFNEVFTDHPFGSFWDISIEPTNGQVLIENDGGISGISLSAGVTISASLESANHVWTNGNASLFGYGLTGAQSPIYSGYFVEGEGYLGISFNVEGSTHYGWIEMSHDKTRPDPYNNSLMILGWAWETEADTPILAGAIPEPSTGILTMVGSLALLQLARSRRRRRNHTRKLVFGYHSPQEPKGLEKW